MLSIPRILASRIKTLVIVFIMLVMLVTPLAKAYADETSSSDAGSALQPTSTDDNAQTSTLSAEPSTPNADVVIQPSPNNNQEVGTGIGEIGVDPNADSTDAADSSKKPTVDSQPAAAMSATSDPHLYNSSATQKVPDTDKSSGALIYDYPLTIPPGRNGLQPNLKLSYNSQNNEEGSILGYGWSLNIPYIERINHDGTDKLYSENYFKSSLDGELISLGSGSYGPKVESGSFNKYSFSSNHWIVTDKLGTQYKFGYNSSTRLDNPNDSTQIYRWMLEEIRDTNGNYIKYTYTKDSGQIYPYQIIYTGNGTTDGIMTLNFVTSSRTDTITSYKAAFLVTTNYRISEINAAINSSWVRKYSLGYAAGDNGYRSMLSIVTESGRDDSGNTTTLPPIQLSYTTSTTGWTQNTSTWQLPRSSQNDRENFMDVNGDAYPDELESFKDPNFDYWNQTQQHTWTNTGNNAWSLNSNLTAPAVMMKYEIRGGAYGGLWDMGYRLSDINGDSLPDIVWGDDGSVNGGFGAWLNNLGSGWTSSNGWSPSIAFTESAGLYNTGGTINDYGTRILDLNGDGLADITRQTPGTYQGTQLNNGSGFSSVTSSWNTPVGLRSPWTQTADLNNDGLPDLVWSYWDGFYATFRETSYLNKGTGAWETNTTNWKSPLHFTNTGITDKGVRFMDINGDGLVDLVVDPGTTASGASGYDTYLNTGNGWVYTPAWDLPPFGNGLINNEEFVGDLNGDGLLDFAYGANCYPDYCSVNTDYLHKGVAPDLLKTVAYPAGGSTTVTYKASPQYKDVSNNLLNPNLPMALPTVYTIVNDDNNGNTSTYTYQYQGGLYYYNGPFERRFAGYSKVTQTDPAGNVTDFYYHQGNSTDATHGEYNDDYYKIGQVYRTEVHDSASHLFSKIINKWDDYNLGNGRKFVKLAQTLESAYDNDSTHKDKATTYTYDNSNGNVTQKTEYGQVTGADDGTFSDTGSDDFTTAYEYASDGTNLVGLPDHVTTVDHNSTKVKESKYYYDGQPYGYVNKGNQTKEEDWKSVNSYVNTQKTYDNTFGTVTTSTDQRGKVTTYTNDGYNIYPATVTDPLSHSNSYTYDYSSGLVKQKTDPNGRVYQNVYDGLDRLVEEKQPDLTTPSTLVTKDTYTYTDTSGAVSVKQSNYLDGSNTSDSYTYFDGLNRKIQERKEAEGSNYSVKDYKYNSIGQMGSESLPYFSTGTSKTSYTALASLYIYYTYDPMYRVINTTDATGSVTNTYDDWKLTTTDKRGKTKDLYKNAYGNLIRVDEHDNFSTYSTYYAYDYLGDLLGITDSAGNIRNFTYDGLGRRLTAQDLHDSLDSTFGSYSYAYDDAGNLTQKVDPNGNTVNYTYDDVNRPLTEDYTGQKGTEVAYSYDSGTDGVGQLTSITAEGLIQNNTYNPNGLLASETKTIDSTDYTTSYDYNRQGNQIVITNPDSSAVQYVYNSAGLLDKVQHKESSDEDFVDVVSDFDYSPLEQVTIAAYNNGMATTNSYDASHLYRLSSKVTTIASGSHGQDLSYSYDPNGNITQIVDSSNTDSAKTVVYTYDDLNRLTSATATNVASGQTAYTENYTYDSIGNITSKTGQGSYAYSGNTGKNYANPHAVTSIGSTDFTYDRNGNMLTNGSSLTNTWDYNNRITQTVAGPLTDTFTYDPSGQRLSMSNGSSTTYYASKFYNTDGTKAQKHIFANGVEVATVEGTGEKALLHSTATDSLTGSNIVTDNGNNTEEVLDYFPFGSVRIDQKSGSYGDQRQYAGSEFDADTGLNYMQARYYDSGIGRFVNQDPAFLAVGDKKQLENITKDKVEGYLYNPQGLNSYSYVMNNPLTRIDPDGQWVWDLVTGKQSWNDFVVEVGDAANILYDNSKVWRTALDHPYVAGAAVGVSSGAAAAGASTVAAAVSATYLGGAGTACVAFCSTVTQKVNSFNAVVQQNEWLDGVTNARAQRVVKDVFRTQDKIPGGTIEAINRQLTSGELTGNKGHITKGWQTVNRINNILSSEKLNPLEYEKLNDIRGQLEKALTQNWK